MKRFILLIVSSMALMPSILMAMAIRVNPLSLFITPAIHYQTITIYNKGKDTAYVKIIPNKVIDPGTTHSKMIKENFKNPYKFGLLVTPNKLILPKGEKREARVLSLNPATIKQDAVYQLNVLPVEGQWVAVKTKQKKSKVGVDLITGYGAITIVRPLNAKPIITLTRHAKELTIHNSGNTYARVFAGEQCVANKCTPIPHSPVLAMYSGNTKHYILPKAEPAKFKYTLVDGTTAIATSN